MDEAVRRLRPDQALEAAGYIRVSLEQQASHGRHSPTTQRDAIKRLAAQEGYALTMIEEDHERGSKVTRVGYQKIIEAVRAGTIHAVMVFMFDRWGRDGAEWLTRAREFERLGVPIISVQEGKDEGGLMRFVRAGMAEEFSRGLAKKVRPNREEGARQGTHMGPTPFGYRRVYPPVTDMRHRPPGKLESDPATAWIVQELYKRYAAGGWSLWTLAVWLNTDPRVPRRADLRTRGLYWTSAIVSWILSNPVYIGMVRYNRKPQGLYERAAPGSVFVAQGQHEPLIDKETFDQVQERLAAASRRPSYNRQQRTVLGSGLFVCGGCGGPTSPFHYTDGKIVYKCSRRRHGSACTAPGYLSRTAHDALLHEICRLRGAPWTPQAEQRIGGTSPEQEVTVVRRALGDERDRLRRHTRLMSLMEEDPTPEQIAMFREVSAEISVRIRALEAQLASMDSIAARVPDLRDLHAQLTKTQIPELVQVLHAAGDQEGLRALVQELVMSARIVERVPVNHPWWLRAEITWKPDVQLLLDHELLTLTAPEPSPKPKTVER